MMKLLKLNKTASSAMRTAAPELRHYSTFCFNFPDASNCSVKLISVFTSRMQSFSTQTNSRCTEKPFNYRPRSQFYHLTATDTGLVLYTFTRLGTVARSDGTPSTRTTTDRSPRVSHASVADADGRTATSERVGKPAHQRCRGPSATMLSFDRLRKDTRCYC